MHPRIGESTHRFQRSRVRGTRHARRGRRRAGLQPVHGLPATRPAGEGGRRARLFDKAGRGLRLNDAGHLLAQHARVLLSAAEAAEADLAALSGDIRGTVRAGGLQSVARRLLVLPAAHPLARPGGPVAVTDLRSEIWTASAEGTGHHAMVVGTCRALGGYEPDLRHRSSDADVQLELARAAAAVALMPALTRPADDPALAIRDIAEAGLKRRLVAATRGRTTHTRADRPPGSRHGPGRHDQPLADAAS